MINFTFAVFRIVSLFRNDIFRIKSRRVSRERDTFARLSHSRQKSHTNCNKIGKTVLGNVRREEFTIRIIMRASLPHTRVFPYNDDMKRWAWNTCAAERLALIWHTDTNLFRLYSFGNTAGAPSLIANFGSCWLPAAEMQWDTTLTREKEGGRRERKREGGEEIRRPIDAI